MAKQPPTGPNTRRHDLYRRGVWCHTCHGPRLFTLDASNGTAFWVCSECRAVELDSDEEIAPSPWVERPAVEAVG